MDALHRALRLYILEGEEGLFSRSWLYALLKNVNFVTRYHLSNEAVSLVLRESKCCIVAHSVSYPIIA
jgi:hypothetical protein